jgi:CTP synthase
MIKVCQYARENQIPYLGICLGMQMAVIEFCQNVLKIENATSKEFDENAENDVITKMEDTSYMKLGGTLRLGSKKTVISNKDSLAYKIYGKEIIEERHRHRYEVNPKYIEEIEKNGMIFSGKDVDKIRMNLCEIPGHPFFFACQSHPEYKTNPLNPSPIFMGFILSASKQYNKFNEYKKTRKIGLEFIESDIVDNYKFKKGGVFDELIEQISYDSNLIIKELGKGN